jgi:hypothetical protein
LLPGGVDARFPLSTTRFAPLFRTLNSKVDDSFLKLAFERGAEKESDVRYITFALDLSS